jgi:predicted nucleic acid-binding protein
MRIVISDTSCFIDLGKGSLVKTVLKLPYAFVMPDVLFYDELLHFGSAAKDDLCALGLQVVELDAHGTRRAMEHFARYRALTVNDSFALALAEQTEDCILLTGDGGLRKIAAGMGIEVHGVLWIIDELEQTRLATAHQLYEALCVFERDELIFLPLSEVQKRLRRLKRLL